MVGPSYPMIESEFPRGAEIHVRDFDSCSTWSARPIVRMSMRKQPHVREHTRAMELHSDRAFVDGMERREHARYGVRALVKFEWMDGGMLRRGQGQTRDISSKGIFIYSPSGPPTKADLEVEVFLSPVAGAVTKLRISAKGLVIRVEPATKFGEDGGFAVLNKSLILLNGAPSED